MYYIINLIKIIHLIIIIICVISIIIPNEKIKKYSLIFLIFILFHYLTNNGKCGLTEIEYYFSNKSYNEGFIYKIIKPIISTPEKYINNYLYILHIIWIYILIKQLKIYK